MLLKADLCAICFYDKMHYARKERFVMNSATIALTSEQKAIIAEKMGLVSDELVLTSLSSTQDVAQIEDIGENLFLAASKPLLSVDGLEWNRWIIALII